MSYRNRYEVYYRINNIEGNCGKTIVVGSQHYSIEEVAKNIIYSECNCDYKDIEILDIYLLDSEYIDDEM